MSTAPAHWRVHQGASLREWRSQAFGDRSGWMLGDPRLSGKTEIVAAIHDARLEELRASSIEEARGSAGTMQLLIAGLQGFIRYSLEHPNYLRMRLREGYAWSGQHVAPTRQRAAAWTEGVAVLTSLIERGRDDREIVCGDPKVEARMLIVAQQVLLADWVKEEGASGYRCPG